MTKYTLRRASSTLSAIGLVAAAGCQFQPLGPVTGRPINPAHQHRPTPELPENPLDPGKRLEVDCSAQGYPLVESSDVKRCEADTVCRVVCRSLDE